MGIWEEQFKRTNQTKRVWAETQEFSFINALANATNEEEVKAAYIREFSLPVNTQERHDLLVDNVLFEFKYSVRLDNWEVSAKVVAQAIYYVYRLLKKDRLSEVKYLVVADKDEARFFRVSDFHLFYESREYDWDNFRPSSPDPKLVQAVKNSKILESNRVYNLTSEEDIHLFSSHLYKVLVPSKVMNKTDKRHYPSMLDVLTVKFGFILILSLTGVLGVHYYFSHNHQSTPVRK
jgi:hypothetical protein